MYYGIVSMTSEFEKKKKNIFTDPFTGWSSMSIQITRLFTIQACVLFTEHQQTYLSIFAMPQGRKGGKKKECHLNIKYLLRNEYYLNL